MVTALLPCCGCPVFPGQAERSIATLTAPDIRDVQSCCGYPGRFPGPQDGLKIRPREASVTSVNLEGHEMDEQRDLEGISALVTGATSGIGKAAAEELSRHGAEVIVHGRDPDRGGAVAGMITAEGGKARFVAADLGDPAQMGHLIEQAGA